MKIIILSAFDGRLRSEPIEWPDEPSTLTIPLAPNTHGTWNLGMDIPSQPVSTIKMGLFQKTGSYQVLANGRTAAIYELVGL